MAVNQREHEIIKPVFRPSIESINTRKWPGLVASSLDHSYWLRDLETPLTMYRMRSSTDDVVLLSSTDKNKLESRSIRNALTDSSRGHAVQLLFDGRGVKAYLEPEWPHLKVKLSVGSMPLDFSNKCKMYPDVKGFVDSRSGTRLVLTGSTKERVGKLMMEIFNQTKASPVTGKGAHIAFNPPRLIKQKLKRK